MSAPFERAFVRGRLFDGTGAPERAGTVAIAGGRMALLPPGRLVEADQVHDIAGLAIAPGFIDVHSHSDFHPFFDPVGLSKAFDGVTLEICGNCGFSAAPLDRFTRETEEKRFAGFGASFGWKDFDGYARAVESSGTSIHRALLVGHGSLRAEVMGYDDRDPTALESDRMAGILGDLLDQGALGLSSGLIYPPGCFSKTDELVALARVAGSRSRLYTSHIRGEGIRLEEAIDEVLTIARESGARTQISHLKASGAKNWHKLAPVLEAIESVRARGYPVMADRYPYTATNTFLYTLFRNWVYEGGTGAQLDRIGDPATRRRILQEMQEDYPAGYFAKILISAAPAAGTNVEGRTVAEIAADGGQDPHEAALDLFARARGEVQAIFFNLHEDNLREVLAKDWVMVASDGSAQVIAEPRFEGKPHPRAYGTFARALGVYARDEALFPLEVGVAKMTGMPARHFGLEGRGVLADGAHADLAIFDPVRIRDRSTYVDPHQLSEGVHTLVVAGELVIDRGRVTAARPGRVLRGGAA